MYIMNSQSSPDTKTELEEVQIDAVRDALVLYFMGQASKKDAFKQTPGVAFSTYTSWKRSIPQQITPIETEARLIAQEHTSDKALAYSAEQLDLSIYVQRRSAQIIKSHLDKLEDICAAKHQVVHDPTKDKDVFVLVYPRDVLGAFKQIQEMARGGVLPEQQLAPVIANQINVDTEKEPEKLLLPSINTNFGIIGDGNGTEVIVEGEFVEAEEV